MKLKVMNKEFEDITKFKKGLTLLEKEGFITKSAMCKDIEHEYAHGKCAKKLGYTILYGYDLCITPIGTKSQFISECTSYIYIKENVSIFKLKKILLAPKKLSEDDIKLLNKLEEVSKNYGDNLLLTDKNVKRLF